MKLLTLARDLKRRKAREHRRLFVAEGVRAVEELLRSTCVVRGALVAPDLDAAPRGAALHERLRAAGWTVEQVSAAELESGADTETPQGVLAIGEILEWSLDSLARDWRGTILLLDGVQDPGNAGTMIRTAAALGAVATVALPGTVDLWNAKVVRGGMGAHFTHPLVSSTWNELDTFRGDAGMTLYAADAAGEEVSGVPRPPRIGLVAGNEGAGLSAEARARADRLVGLRLAPAVESLNVAVAAGILLYSLTR